MVKGSIIVSLLFLFASTTSLKAATFYVSPGGNDTSTGTTSSPFKTVSKAFSLSQAGDTIYLKNGTYPAFEVPKSGSSGNYITIAAASGENPVISGGSNGINLNGKSFIKIIGLEVKGATGSYGAGIMIQNGANNNIIDSCIIHDNLGVRTHGLIIYNSSGNKVLNSKVYNNYSVGLKMNAGATGNEFTGNTVYGHMGDPPNSDGIALSDTNTQGNLLKNNIVYGNGDDGIDTWNTSRQTLIGNVVYKNIGPGDGNGFKLGGTETGGNNLVIGNISYGNKRAGFDSNHSGNNVYYNNVAFGNGGVGFEDINKFANCTVSNCKSIYINNIGMNNGANFAAGPHTYISHNNIWFSVSGGADVSYQGAGNFSDLNSFYNASGRRLDNPNGGTLSSFSVNPSFVNTAAGNFRLNANSPAINKGDPANPGNIGASGTPDIGAFEYNGTQIVPTPTAPPKRGDINRDGKVDIVDIGIAIDNYGRTGVNTADLNADTKVNIIDIGVIIDNYGR